MTEMISIVLKAIEAIQNNTDRIVDAVFEMKEFMGESSTDRKALHDKLDQHGETLKEHNVRILRLEAPKPEVKKKVGLA